MTPHETQNLRHPSAPLLASCSWDTDRGNFGAQLKSSYRRHAPSSLSRNGMRHCAVTCLIQSTVAFVACEWGCSSCLEYRGSGANRPSKSTDRVVNRPTNWSDAFLPTSLSPCGERTLRHHSRPSSVAACAPSNATWKARANGPVRPSQQSSRKFSFDIECATSA